MYNSNTDLLKLILGVEVFFSLGHCSGALCILIISIYVSTEKQPRIVVTRKICAGPVPPAELPPRRRGRASNLRLGWRGVVLVRAGGRAEAAGDGDTDGPGQARAAGRRRRYNEHQFCHLQLHSTTAAAAPRHGRHK